MAAYAVSIRPIALNLEAAGTNLPICTRPKLAGASARGRPLQRSLSCTAQLRASSEAQLVNRSFCIAFLALLRRAHALRASLTAWFAGSPPRDQLAFTKRPVASKAKERIDAVPAQWSSITLPSSLLLSTLHGHTPSNSIAVASGVTLIGPSSYPRSRGNMAQRPE